MPAVVLLSIATGREGLVTKFALERPIARMLPFMHLEIRLVFKYFSAWSVRFAWRRKREDGVSEENGSAG